MGEWMVLSNDLDVALKRQQYWKKKEKKKGIFYSSLSKPIF